MSGAPAVPVVVHVIPTAVARGAQREARALADHLEVPGRRHHVLLSLFAGPEEVPVDVSLAHPGGSGVLAQGFDPRLVVRLRRHLRRMAPAVVVAHGGDPLKYVVPASLGTRRPVAYYATGTFAAAARPARVALWRGLLGRTAVVACEGDEVLAECRDLLGVPPGRLVLAPNGRDPEVFRPDDALGDRAGEDPLVVFVGALNEGKGPDRFVEVVAALRESGRALRARAYGDGPMRAQLEAPARAAGVELCGTVDDVAGALRGADVMVFASRPTGEGMPGVLIEAGLSAVPVVATAVPGTGAIVADGVTGHLVPVDDLPAMTEATARLLDDPDHRRAMGAAARRRCVERFSLSQVVAVWSSFLEPLLAP